MAITALPGASISSVLSPAGQSASPDAFVDAVITCTALNSAVIAGVVLRDHLRCLLVLSPAIRHQVIINNVTADAGK